MISNSGATNGIRTHDLMLTMHALYHLSYRGLINRLNIANLLCFCYTFKRSSADIAQLVEQLFCKQRVVGSSPSVGSILQILFYLLT